MLLDIHFYSCKRGDVILKNVLTEGVECVIRILASVRERERQRERVGERERRLKLRIISLTSYYTA